MHEDLRRQALESKKTVSKKARSKQLSGKSSPANSRSGSRAGSRVQSREVSDDEDANFSDDTGWSVASMEGLLSGSEGEQGISWTDDLSTRIPRIIEGGRKGRSIQGLEEDLAVYVHILRMNFAKSQIATQLPDLAFAFLKNAKTETSEREALLSLKAIEISIFTDPMNDGVSFDVLEEPLKRIITSSEHAPIKTEAIYALGAACFFSSSSTDDNEDLMAYLLEIIESDGEFVSAHDSGDVVTAALETWGFLATQQDDMEEDSPAAIEAFMEQLDSTDLRVQVASGEDIALLYEKSFTEAESDEELSDEELDFERAMQKPVKEPRYEPFRRKDQLLQKLSDLSKSSSKGISKKYRKSLHTNFADIVQSVENPTLGPKHSSALDKEGRVYGNRMTVKMVKKNKDNTVSKRMMRIDAWWKLFRLQALRHICQEGFLEHYEFNEVFMETLPVISWSEGDQRH